MLIDVIEYSVDVFKAVRGLEDKAAIPERYQHAVALLDAVEHVAANHVEDNAFLEGVGKKYIWHRLKKIGYYIEGEFLEAHHADRCD